MCVFTFALSLSFSACVAPPSQVGGRGLDGREEAASSSSSMISRDAEGRERLIFNVPDCLPDCQMADKKRYIEEGVIESRLVAAIDRAESSVDFAMFTFSRGPIFDALVRAAERGVRVRGIIDQGQLSGVGSECATGTCALPAPFDSDLYLAGDIPTRLTMAEEVDVYKASSRAQRLLLLLHGLPNGSGIRGAPGKRRLVHDKFVMVDGDEMLSGSGNWSSTAVSLNLENLVQFYRDTDAEVLDSFMCRYELVWAGDGSVIANQMASCQTAEIRFSPATSNTSSMLSRIVTEIDATRSSVEISMHHLTESNIIAALGRALDRGVAVSLLFDDDDCRTRRETWVVDLEKRGAQIRYMPTDCSLFQLSHNKFGIFDRVRVINGSGNWSVAGLRRNYENFVVFDAPLDVNGFGAFFDEAFSQALAHTACVCDAAEPACRAKYCMDAGSGH